MTEVSNELVPARLAPGLIPVGFAEKVLERAGLTTEPEALWDAATGLAGLAQKWNGHGREKNEIKSAQMYCEIELGQRLGPNPGAQPGPGRQARHSGRSGFGLGRSR